MPPGYGPPATTVDIVVLLICGELLRLLFC